MTTLNQAGLGDALVPMPSLEEQQHITKVLLAVESKIQLHERRRRSLTDLFRTLLQQFMTAQIRVNDRDIPKLESEIP